jgi:ribose transport system permease protein
VLPWSGSLRLNAETASMRPRSGGSWRERRLAPLVGSTLAAAGFVPVWLTAAGLIAISAIIAPGTLSGISWSTGVLPFMSFLAVAALGEMLVIMTGGIDLCIPGVVTLAGLLLVGYAGGSNANLATAIAACLGWSALVGLVNGVLVGVVGLNPLIVTLAVGQIVLGLAQWRLTHIVVESAVPSALSSWAQDEFLGVTLLFWTGAAVTVFVALCLRYTSVGRRFQAVGANPQAAWVAGVKVRRHIVFAYVAACVLYGVAGIMLAAFAKNPGLGLGDPYLLGPIAAVVIGGASLAGGLASVTSTWAAAFALTLLAQMLRVRGLSTNLQFVVFGAAIAAGMVISGDRVVSFLGGILRRPGVQRFLGTGDDATSTEERRDAFNEDQAALQGRAAETDPR